MCWYCSERMWRGIETSPKHMNLPKTHEGNYKIPTFTQVWWWWGGFLLCFILFCTCTYMYIVAVVKSTPTNADKGCVCVCVSVCVRGCVLI